ncbi:DUF1177 domain-containing protein [Natronincola ferrireducens]|uniref:DUF1177 domain-containing protein n=1 Tax=Natronincola ferrireducens TaxID=393762 RepID=A0A1G9E3V6_9FIRM|nr:DUF1177 domain-containing protein [Natronincola ferrireducens]SDK70783.1 Protein of unknown function [Natronincola ferrireducens]
MILKQVLEIYELIDRADASGEKLKAFFESKGATDITVTKILGKQGSTDFIKVVIAGKHGKLKGGDAPTLGIIGRLGGLGARPEVIGYVSDGDGAVAAMSVALKLVEMQNRGDVLRGDVIVTTHICPDAPTEEHYPVPFMGSPVDMDQMNEIEVLTEMDAILSIDTTKGNEIINHKGFAISPTVKEGYILPVSYDLLQIMKRVTGRLPNVFALSTQDITPYSNKLPHINSILQPAVATSAPVVGVAITTEVAVAGCATGASHVIDIEMAGRYAIEVAKDYSEGKCSFYCPENYQKLIELYGESKYLQTPGRE